MFGYACDETPEMMPLPISLAHRLALQLAKVRHEKLLDYLLPDGKTQVSIDYKEGIPVSINTILISTQHSAEIDGITDEKEIREKIKKDLWNYVVLPATDDLDIKPTSKQTRFLVNPTGKFVVGGPQGDAGLTGRKIIVDTYGGYARHGGGAFSGKDPTKVDRSAAYAARYVAKSIVKAKLAKKAEVQLSYAIGVAKPISILVETFGTGIISQANLTELIKKIFDLRPAAIIKEFDLKNLPKKMDGEFYRKTASYGHFGRNDLNLPWENTKEKARQLVEASKEFL
tara:strand:- start:183 stop:1037 length:855 start_codon:yes stop_codon:yes gene_type:complete